jgi:hypothetical protein
MNIALGALIILLLLLPALFFRMGIFFIRGVSEAVPNEADKFSQELVRRNLVNTLYKLNFSETLFFFSIIPLVLHTVSLLILHFFRIEIDYKLILNVFASQKDLAADSFKFDGELLWFLFYVLIEIALGFICGIIFTGVVMRRPKLLRRLAGDNIWFKLFTGLMLTEESRSQISFILVDILSETKEATVIYNGFLEKFDVKPDTGELDYIIITTATRRDLRSGFNTEDYPSEKGNNGGKIAAYLDDNGPVIPIPGKYFTIPGNKISNLNVKYMTLKAELDEEGNFLGMQLEAVE